MCLLFWGLAVGHNGISLPHKVLGPVGVSAAVLVPDALAAQILDSVGFLDIEPPSLEVPKERNQAVALIPVRVPRTAQIFVQCELLDPGMVLAYAIHDSATLDDVGEYRLLEHDPAAGVLLGGLAPGYVGA